MSLETWVIPTNFKLAYARSLLKKLDLDPDALNHYRPVSNLSLLGKRTERVVGYRLTGHMTYFGLLESFQPAYRSNHSMKPLCYVYSMIFCRLWMSRRWGYLFGYICPVPSTQLIMPSFWEGCRMRWASVEQPSLVQVLPREQTPAHWRQR